VDRLRRKRNFTKSEREEIVKEMVQGYEKIAAVNEELVKNVSLSKDGTN
jgi:transposase-like protein